MSHDFYTVYGPSRLPIQDAEITTTVGNAAIATMLLVTNVVIIVVIAMDAHTSTKMRRMSSKVSSLRARNTGGIPAFEKGSVIEMTNPLIRVNQRTGSVRAPTGNGANRMAAAVDTPEQRQQHRVQVVSLSERSRRFLDARSSVNSSIDNFELDESDGEEATEEGVVPNRVRNDEVEEAPRHQDNGSDHGRGSGGDEQEVHTEEATCTDVANAV